MQKVKAMIEAGASFASAVKEALGIQIQTFCEQHGIDRPLFSTMINMRSVPTTDQVDALTAELGGSSQEWIDLWFSCARNAAQATI